MCKNLCTSSASQINIMFSALLFTKQHRNAWCANSMLRFKKKATLLSKLRNNVGTFAIAYSDEAIRVSMLSEFIWNTMNMTSMTVSRFIGTNTNDEISTAISLCLRQHSLQHKQLWDRFTFANQVHTLSIYHHLRSARSRVVVGAHRHSVSTCGHDCHEITLSEV
jgi:hypothetical protein